jgi:hypothetical protein
MPTPYYQQFDAIGTPNGTWIKPGGRVAAYVRSTGLQEGDDLFAMSGNLVPTIAAGVARCRPGRNDLVQVLEGHTETFSSAGSVIAMVAGAQIVGVSSPFSSNAPTITLSHAGASLALSAANVTLQGLRIVSTTAALTGALVVTAAGVRLLGNYITLTGALGANPAIAVTAAANFQMLGNFVVADCTDPIVEITDAATTNMLIARNFVRQAQATSGGACFSIANTAGISGMICDNRMKTAVTSTDGAGGVVIGAGAATTVANVENYIDDEAVSGGILATGA